LNITFILPCLFFLSLFPSEFAIYVPADGHRAGGPESSAARGRSRAKREAVRQNRSEASQRYLRLRRRVSPVCFLCSCFYSIILSRLAGVPLIDRTAGRYG
jgi:hypothetical protein